MELKHDDPTKHAFILHESTKGHLSGKKCIAKKATWNRKSNTSKLRHINYKTQGKK